MAIRDDLQLALIPLVRAATNWLEDRIANDNAAKGFYRCSQCGQLKFRTAFFTDGAGTPLMCRMCGVKLVGKSECNADEVFAAMVAGVDK